MFTQLTQEKFKEFLTLINKLKSRNHSLEHKVARQYLGHIILSVSLQLSDIRGLKWTDVYPLGYLQGHTDRRQKARGWRPHSVVGASCCCWGLPSVQASGDTWEPRSAGPCTPSGAAPAALYPRCSSESLASAAAAARTSSTRPAKTKAAGKLGENGGRGHLMCFTDYIPLKSVGEKEKPFRCDGTGLTHGTCCLRPSISCFTQLNTARYTSSSDGTLRLSLEIRSRTWMKTTKLMGRDVVQDHLQEQHSAVVLANSDCKSFMTKCVIVQEVCCPLLSPSLIGLLICFTLTDW